MMPLLNQLAMTPCNKKPSFDQYTFACSSKSVESTASRLWQSPHKRRALRYREIVLRQQLPAPPVWLPSEHCVERNEPEYPDSPLAARMLATWQYIEEEDDEQQDGSEAEPMMEVSEASQDHLVESTSSELDQNLRCQDMSFGKLTAIWNGSDQTSISSFAEDLWDVQETTQCPQGRKRIGDPLVL